MVKDIPIYFEYKGLKKLFLFIKIFKGLSNKNKNHKIIKKGYIKRAKSVNNSNLNKLKNNLPYSYLNFILNFDFKNPQKNRTSKK